MCAGATAALAVSRSAAKPTLPRVDPMVATAAEAAMYGWLPIETSRHFSLSKTIPIDGRRVVLTVRERRCTALDPMI
jgi:hypothetical protein